MTGTKRLAGIFAVADTVPVSSRAAAGALCVAAILFAAASGYLLDQRARLFQAAERISVRENARPVPPSGTRFGQWQIQCRSPQSTHDCWVETAAQLPGGEIGWLQIRPRPAGAAGFEMLALLPLGIDLRRGVAFSVPGFESFVLPLQYCTSAGCLVAFQPSLASWLGMRAGSAVEIVYRPSAAASDTRAEFSMDGLAAAFTGLR
jgi:invasion protein IalB